MHAPDTFYLAALQKQTNKQTTALIEYYMHNYFFY